MLIVLPSSSYRVADFVAAAKMLRAETVIATNAAQAMAGDMAYPLVRIDPRNPEWSASRIVEIAQRFPLDAVVAADEEGVVMAALAAPIASGGKSSRLVLTTYSANFLVTSTMVLPLGN